MPRTGPDQVLDATLECIARFGLAKTTLEDVAREAGCARASVYRWFTSKQQLIAALVEREVARLGNRLLADAADAVTLGDAVTAVVTGAARALLDHRALVFVTTHETEALLPYLTFERESAVLGAAAVLVAPAFERFLPAAEATRLGEWIARITFSYLCSPSADVDVCDPQSVRALVDDFVLPGFARPVPFQGVSE